MDTIWDSVQQFLDKMHAVGYSAKSISIASAVLSKLIHFHNENSCEKLSPELAEKYISNIQAMLDADALGRYFAKQQIWFIRKYIEYCAIGQITANHTNRYAFPKFPLPKNQEVIIQAYLEEISKNTQRIKEYAWAPKRYAYWLSKHNIKSFSESKITDLRQYLIDEMKQLKSRTISSLRSTLRHFHKWLFEKGYIPNTYEELFDFRIAIENKIHPAPLPNDVAKILKQVDRNSDIGKRNYAALLLGTVLGLRGSDIIGLNLTDIDWRQGEIRIVQCKTGKPLMLPLTKDVADALQDYILNGRPKSDDTHIFLRHHLPYTRLKSGSTLGNIYTAYMKQAGVDGERGLYALRRALGKNLVVSGTPVTTVSQILGHTDISSTKQYIALDTQHLKLCTLSFADILPKRWNQ